MSTAQEIPQSPRRALLQAWVPVRLREAGGDPLRRAQVTAAACLLIFAAHCAGMAYTALEGWPVLLAAMAGGCVLWGVALVVLRMSGNLAAVGNLLPAIITASAVPVAVMDGGVTAPALMALVAAPAVATFVAGRWWGGLWTAVGVSIVWALLLLHVGEGPALLTAHERPLGAAMIATVLMLVIGLLSAAFEAANARAVEDLERALADAESLRDAAQQASKVKSVFLANVSHELRTPLNAIIGYSEMLVDDAALDGAAEREEDMRQVLSAGNHLLSLINDLLDISRIEAGRMIVTIETADLRHLVDDLVPMARQLATDNGNQFEVEQPSRPVVLHTDIQKVRQILLNLLGNASKFTAKGTIRLTARALRADGAPYVEFLITDTGIGMTEEQVGRVFDSFVQADSSVTRKYGGTGLGLRISLRLAQLLGGGIQVRTRKDQGSTFTLRLPTTAPQTADQSLVTES